jgi:hypothetical protein
MILGIHQCINGDNMADGKDKTIDVDKLLKNKLKAVSIGSLENAISKVVSEMVGEDYKCTIGEVKYTLFSGADFHVKIELTYNPEQ